MAKREKKGKSKSSAGYNQKIGEDFLLQNAQKDGVVETASGLQYKIVEEVAGEKPNPESTVLIHQRALLLNGTTLEDTYRKNKPDEVRLAELIEGLQEGLQLMGKGSRYKFWVPADLAWGRKGTSNKIPPFAVLSFDIRLVDLIE
ncbi:FKBP-type peptidyl-prolyl cis-trans isomerase [Sunxiuqinia dokdonensis]|uniref:Peptidyl-prolyl cis-trans isomerase n=1 Tax=Sunxiuqinia dokdonensis TaxID=1409788 RepID=A0A0L8VDW9_9BACT|nr:FKBP-type peptidyl-prolyl cis-trans isomerase [Sunxiuqinia dokdonensis]KOH46387.1 peptidyl-prolyl cis-trans isomerase fkpA domain-containing protein [Sunxiuqinia dokdonensis]